MLKVNYFLLLRSRAKQYSNEELLLMKTQDIQYVLQKAQSEKKVQTLLSTLHNVKAEYFYIFLQYFNGFIMNDAESRATSVFTSLHWLPSFKQTHLFCRRQVLLTCQFCSVSHNTFSYQMCDHRYGKSKCMHQH